MSFEDAEGLCATKEASLVSLATAVDRVGGRWLLLLLLMVGCLTSPQQAQICSHSCTCCHTEIEVAGYTFHLAQSQYTDNGPTSPSADPLTPGVWQSSRWSGDIGVTDIAGRPE